MIPLILPFLLFSFMQNDTATAARFTPRELPYAYDALEIGRAHV